MFLRGVFPSNIRGKILLYVVEMPVAVTVDTPSFKATGISSKVAKPSSIIVLYAPVSKITTEVAYDFL